MAAVSGSGQRDISHMRTFALHLLAFVLPLITLIFWLTGPHSWWSSLIWATIVYPLVLIDNAAPKDHRQPPDDLPNWPYNLQVYLLVALQMTNHALMLHVASQLHVNTLGGAVQTVFMALPVISVAGLTAGYSGIVLAHELVHRRSKWEFLMGRMLLSAVCYEHFATEHIRGHHPRVGTLEDPATARFGETLSAFVKRTIPAQFKSAWQLEKVRAGDKNLPWYSPKWLGHRVLQGVVVEALTCAAIGYSFGGIALVFFLLQAATAILALEIVNYMEHWGLARSSKKVVAADSWDTDNYCTLYTLVGLSRHADHHAQASRPYHKLRHFEETAKMPRGYYGTIALALVANKTYRRLATAELKRKGLGPFRKVEQPTPVSHLHPLLQQQQAVHNQDRVA